MKYKLIRGRYSRYENGVLFRYFQGDTIELNDEEAKRLEVRVEPVMVALAGMNAREAIKAIRAIEDLGELEEALQGEVDGKSRKSVLAAGNARLAALVAADEED